MNFVKMMGERFVIHFGLAVQCDIHPVQEKVSQLFSSYLLQNSVDSDTSWHIVSWINLLRSTAHVFYLTWILSLHYLVQPKIVSVKILMLCSPKVSQFSAYIYYDFSKL